MTQSLVVRTAPLPLIPAGVLVIYAGEAMPLRGQAAEIWGSTGLDFLRRLKQRHLHVPVVYVTGSSEATIAVEALKAGAADYVIKTVGEVLRSTA